MTSNRPYLLRALYDWIGDNGLTPHILVDAEAPGLRVPPGVARDGRVVLNIAARAVGKFEIDQDSMRFLARFGGVSQSVVVPITAIRAIYARENGQGMQFPPEPPGEDPPAPPDTPPSAPEDGGRRNHLRVVK
jgi:stringent starvation protein B